MVVCHTSLSPLSNLMGLSYWVALTVIIFLLCTRFTWDDNKYAFFRVQALFIPQSTLFYYIYFWLGLNSFSAWLVWFCNDWDAAPLTLIFYVVKIMMLSFVSPAFMLTTKIWIPITMAILALIASIVSCVLFFIRNDWAGICGVVDIITMGIILLVLSCIAIFKKPALAEWLVARNKPELFIVRGNGPENQSAEPEEDFIENSRKRIHVDKSKKINLKL